MPADGRPIVHILPAEPFGGLQALVIELARVQKSTGKAVSLILLGPSPRVEERCRSAGVAATVLAGPKFSRMLTLWRILRQKGIAILHSHCEPIWASIVLSLHARSWFSHLHVYPSGKSARDRLAHTLRRRSVRQFIAITGSIAQSYIDAGLAPANRVEVIYNGLDVASLPKPMRRIADRPFTVAFVGRAVREKGLFDFIDTVDLLRDEPDLRFIIAGEGADLAEAREIIAERGLTDRISVLGFVTDTNALWHELDLLLMLSTREPFGLVILEAIASGVGVLGYDVPSGGSEIMATVPGCTMVPAFSIDALATAVLATSRDRDALNTQVLAGRAVVIDRFSLDRMEGSLARNYVLAERSQIPDRFFSQVQ